MITPNKFTTFDKTVLSKIGVILDHGNGDIELKVLFNKTISKFEDINQFIFTLDVLYVLDRINIDFKTGIVKYVV